MKISRKALTTLLIILLPLAGIIAFLSQLVTINELVHPQHIDSLYVHVREANYRSKLGENEKGASAHFYYNPGDLGMPFSDLDIVTVDSVTIKAWFIPPEYTDNNIILVLLHDLGESRISCLETASQFHDRGFTVVLPDLRAHGASGGSIFTFGQKERSDLLLLLDTLKKQTSSDHITILARGISCMIAVQALAEERSVRGLILQSPGDRLVDLIRDHSNGKWGILNNLLFGILKKNLEEELGYSTDSIRTTALARDVYQSTMCIVGGEDKVVSPVYSKAVFDTLGICSPYPVIKEYWTIAGAGHYDIEKAGGEDYFNKISLFLVKSIPAKEKKTRFKKLAEAQ